VNDPRGNGPQANDPTKKWTERKLKSRWIFEISAVMVCWLALVSVEEIVLKSVVAV